jgi:hypothetical protein
MGPYFDHDADGFAERTGGSAGTTVCSCGTATATA